MFITGTTTLPQYTVDSVGATNRCGSTRRAGMNIPTVPSGAATLSSTLRQVHDWTRAALASRAFTARPGFSSLPEHWNGTIFFVSSSYHFISHETKSILTPFFIIQDSHSKNSSVAPSTINASTSMVCSYWVRNLNRHSPSTRETAPVKPST
ncbi:hypothetical protein PF010_g29032 [Phytophthora fragariae]|uniref:Uncharacterized protein n=1 Tax=Phytophthora fragariae TaxID=53985 RepID=A0A6G0JPV5_9STRA|nr:hypothetical protein PF010_g29032 [Phytophthora fragariae]